MGSGQNADTWVMKRDMDLIREILLFAEANCDGKDDFVIEVAHLSGKFPNITPEKLNEHVTLTIERELIEANGTFGDYGISRLTWEGHEFLDNSREPAIWNATKKAAGHLSFGVFCSVLTQLATNHGLGLLKSGFSAAVETVSGGGS